ncbi:hypothetical protein BDR07DRAFT_1380514 [Suillus spraguei]|nr:hypothetical protein BDR07DRAFT_1380514 [Suillus spraguei]
MAVLENSVVVMVSGAIPPSSLALHTPQPFNLGFTLPFPAQQPAPKPFNMGFNLPVQSTGTPLPTMPLPTTPLPTTSQPFNLNFNLPMAVTTPAICFGLVQAQADTLRHVGYDINNRSFQFGCKPPSPIAEWQPELIQALHPSPPVASSPAAIADAAPGPSIPRPLPHTGGHVEWLKLKSLVGDAEHSAIDIVKHLGGEEFDHLAQMMVGSTLGLGDDVRDPKPDEVLESNQMMLMAFCESRDWLTRIFKDLINLHHLAQVHEQVLPAVESLLDEVDKAEAESGQDM